MHWSHTPHVSSSWHTRSGIGSSASPWHGILSAPGLEAHSSLPCHVLYAQLEEVGGYLFIFWFRNTEEKKINRNFQIWGFIPPPKISKCASESHFSTHCRNLREFQDSLTHCFSSFVLTNCGHLFSFWGIRILFLLSHSFRGSRVKGEQNHLKMSASEMQSLNPACPFFILGLFLFRAFRSSPLWIREPWKCLSVPP